MKINAPTTRPTLGTESATQRNTLAQAYGGAVSGNSTGGSSQVALSNTSRALSDLQDGKSDIDTARVAEIKAAIASGQLKIDAGKIADGIIASARELVK
ncbi:flagellar biosynthesis anti-sigma factor FlgM [Bordetella sp. N]|uniref:flagellar biosynthesis anti-sigma factor FlgM n=1 Tax=Bordetella sp. N TaxID=1746199 RepID=UPI000710E0C7|nr:flagellar biosynthesis anti-sigma factor FlgM [Bordetella sp. N]ALM83199.1 flagellar biosynthesis anti-sigma factor FlgM [Bordetella sp. N]